MTVNKDRADSWNVSKPHSYDSCGGAEHIDIGRFDSDGKRDEFFGKHHVTMSDVGELIGVLKNIISITLFNLARYFFYKYILI